MRVLVACECSGLVRDAFIKMGHEAMSCDLQDTEHPGPHYKGSVMDLVHLKWDLMVAHPPCTYLCNSGVRWLYERETRWQDMIRGAVFFRSLLELNIPKIAVENPIMHQWARLIIGRGPDQIVHPWQFGYPETKATGLWLKGLPRLEPTEIELPTNQSIHKMSQTKSRRKDRSRTFPLIGMAMAQQWGILK